MSPDKLKNNILQSLIVLAVTVLLYAFLNIFPTNSVIEFLLKIVLGIAGGMLLNIILFIINNKHYAKVWWYSKIKYRKEDIRLSLSYLFKIKHRNRYLLVKGNVVANQLQPVGGVYKYFPQAKSFLDDLKVRDDDKVDMNGSRRDDFRLRIKGTDLLEFLKWYNSKKDREVSAWREFCEELVKPKILSFDNFAHIQYRYIRTEKVEFTYSDHYDCIEYKMYDIYEPLFTEKQLTEIDAIYTENEDYSKEYAWVSEQLINWLGHNQLTKQKECIIGTHTKYLLK